jgi:hypothetical protein
MLEPAHILMNLGVCSGLNYTTPGLAAQFGMTWAAMITSKTKMGGSKVKD